MNKHEQTYARIRQRILDGTFAPGHRLVLDALARDFGISPVPVREALRRLEAEGWIIYKPNVGAQVAPIDEGRWEQEMRVLAVLEGNATALAAPYLHRSDFLRLNQLNDAMRTALNDGDMVEFSALNRRWHFSIYERCPNTYLLELIEETYERLGALRRTVFTYVPERTRESLAEHKQIRDLLQCGAKFAEIESAARAHKLRTVDAFLSSQHTHTEQPKEMA
jgi:DNA-binding GntR family transcriptional regulator